MGRLTQWLMALAGLLASASMCSCSGGNNQSAIDTEQSDVKHAKDGSVERLPPTENNDVVIADYNDVASDDFEKIADKTCSVGGFGPAMYGPQAAPPTWLRGEILLVRDTEVTDGLDKRIVQKIMRIHRPETRACYERECERDKSVSNGEVTVSWSIDKSGTVSDVIIGATTLHNKRVEDCLIETIQRWQFPHPRAVDSVHVTTVFVFRPKAD